MKVFVFVFVAIVAITLTGCSPTDPISKSSTPTPSAQADLPPAVVSKPLDNSPVAKDSDYKPPTADEMAPMRAEYLAELAKIHEPPEMANKPMRVRRVVPESVVKLGLMMNSIGAPEKATHQQRATAIRELLEFANSSDPKDDNGRSKAMAAAAFLSCLDGADTKLVIEYASEAVKDGNDALALRARMYLRAGDSKNALDDLEKVMMDGEARALASGDVDPSKGSVPCGWSVADFEALGEEPRALAAEGLYLSSFIGFGAVDRGTVKESNIRDLYARSARSWHSPIPHVLTLTLDVIGSAHSMNAARCIRTRPGFAGPRSDNTCDVYDEEERQEIRELTMALIIEPTFARAFSERAAKYLRMAQSSYASGKPSRQFFELAIKDYAAALAAGATNQHSLYCDRALALASVGRYQDAVSGYMQGMKHAQDGEEGSPFVYEQLAQLYMKWRKFNEAANLLTQAIMNSSGGGMDTIVFGGGIRAFRTLYPEYDALPDEILAEDLRRRYEPQFPESWDTEFISNTGFSRGKINSSVLVELYVLRGDAYMKAGLVGEALADYRRVKSDAWAGDEPLLPRHIYFDERGMRNVGLPEAWPPPAPTI
jgi:tetratricopeptide (TPR) repeat protein